MEGAKISEEKQEDINDHQAEEIIEELQPRISTRSGIHSEIEERLINKLYKMAENIEIVDGQLNFEPYTDHVLLQLETFLEKKFAEKVFDPVKDEQTYFFLKQIKKERDRREFGFAL